jgi:hypothetical protein
MDNETVPMGAVSLRLDSGNEMGQRASDGMGWDGMDGWMDAWMDERYGRFGKVGRLQCPTSQMAWRGLLGCKLARAMIVGTSGRTSGWLSGTMRQRCED